MTPHPAPVMSRGEGIAGTGTDMTPEERIDAAIDSILKASGSALKHYTMQSTLDEMRKAMRKIMSDSYIDGSNDAFNALKKQRQL